MIIQDASQQTNLESFEHQLDIRLRKIVGKLLSANETSIQEKKKIADRLQQAKFKFLKSVSSYHSKCREKLESEVFLKEPSTLLNDYELQFLSIWNQESIN